MFENNERENNEKAFVLEKLYLNCSIMTSGDCDED